MENTYSAKSLQGARAYHQDEFRVEKFDNRWLLVLADGMGGTNEGGEASKIAADTVVASAPQSEEDVFEAMISAHKAVEAGCEGGTTLVVALILGNIAYVGSVGDSRAYSIRDGRLNRITTDDNVFSEMILAGRIDSSEEENHSTYARMRSMLTVCLGKVNDGDILPAITKHVFGEGDKLLLGSDGLWDVWNDRTLSEKLAACHYDAEVICEEMIKDGGSDNTTAVIFEF